jgi:DNA repair exonuclease SbcCD ATPase subunit
MENNLMDDTDFDFLCDGLPADEAKRLRKLFKEWCDGDENSFPVQLALLTRAQWRAAAKVPVQMKQSLEQLDQKLAEYRQQTGTLLKNFNAAVNTKTEELKDILAEQRDEANVVLADLRVHTANAKDATEQLQEELDKGQREMKRILEYTEKERKRLETAVREYDEQRSQWSVIWFLLLLVAVLIVGYLLGKYWH